MTEEFSKNPGENSATATGSPDVVFPDESANQPQIIDNKNELASVATTDVATTAAAPVATEVTSSEIACPVPLALVDQPRKLPLPARALRALLKAQSKRDSDALWEDPTPARWFDDEIEAQAKKIARAEAKKAAKSKAH